MLNPLCYALNSLLYRRLFITVNGSILHDWFPIVPRSICTLDLTNLPDPFNVEGIIVMGSTLGDALEPFSQLLPHVNICVTRGHPKSFHYGDVTCIGSHGDKREDFRHVTPHPRVGITTLKNYMILILSI